MKTFALALAALVCAASAALASDAMVLDGASAKDGLGPGDRFASSTTLNLSAGETLLVATQSGDVVDLVGPFTGALPVEGGPGAGGDERSMEMVKKLVIGEGGRDAVLGASLEASTGGPAGAAGGPAPNVWVLDTSAEGRHCVADTVTLWRPEAKEAVRVAARDAFSASARLDWPSGETMLDLPQEFATPGRMTVTLGNETLRYEFVRVPDTTDESEPGELLLGLAASGCEAQAARLVERMRAE